MNTKNFLLSILSVAALAACGGGGGDAAPAAATGPAAATTAASKYAGTWKSACFKNTSDVRTNPSDPNALAYQTRSYTFVATGASSASVVWTDTYYSDTDTNCAVVEEEVIRPNTNTATIDGTTNTVASSVPSQLVDQLTLVFARPFPSNPITAPTTYRSTNGGLTYFPITYDQATTVKQIALVTSTTLTFGAPGVANPYPTLLGTTPNLIYTKQP